MRINGRGFLLSILGLALALAGASAAQALPKDEINRRCSCGCKFQDAKGKVYTGKLEPFWTNTSCSSLNGRVQDHPSGQTCEDKTHIAVTYTITRCADTTSSYGSSSGGSRTLGHLPGGSVLTH